LKDVLENEAIKLDWNFRMSLIHDIVKVEAGAEVVFLIKFLNISQYI